MNIEVTKENIEEMNNLYINLIRFYSLGRERQSILLRKLAKEINRVKGSIHNEKLSECNNEY